MNAQVADLSESKRRHVDDDGHEREEWDSEEHRAEDPDRSGKPEL